MHMSKITDISDFLRQVTAAVGDIFDGAFFHEINNTLHNAYLVLGQHHGKLTAAAETFCNVEEKGEGIYAVKYSFWICISLRVI